MEKCQKIRLLPLEGNSLGQQGRLQPWSHLLLSISGQSSTQIQELPGCGTQGAIQGKGHHPPQWGNTCWGASREAWEQSDTAYGAHCGWEGGTVDFKIPSAKIQTWKAASCSTNPLFAVYMAVVPRAQMRPIVPGTARRFILRQSLLLRAQNWHRMVFPTKAQ